MSALQCHEDDSVRLAALRALDILDAPPEGRLDPLTRLARGLFGVRAARVHVADDDAAAWGPDATVVVSDPALPFYAGCTLTGDCGGRIGTLSLHDSAPRGFSDDEHDLLAELARLAARELSARRLSTVDALTRLSDRHGVERLGNQLLDSCARLDRQATAILFDLDGLGAINARFGHAEGDRALARFGRILREVFRESDIVGRVGGDEFVVVTTGDEAAASDGAIDRLDRAVDAFNVHAARGYALSFSVGRAQYAPSRHASARDLIREADARAGRPVPVRDASNDGERSSGEHDDAWRPAA